MLFAFSFVVFSLLLRLSDAKDTVVVETKIGAIRGHVRTIEPFGKPLKVRQFLGVPYAEPPVGPLRFQKPQAKSKMDRTFDATEFKHGCLQLYMDLSAQGKSMPDNWLDGFSNDCLFLNIFTPGDQISGKAYPVMIIIHGGGFVVGMSDIYAGHITSSFADVIVVSINYRLGIFGFLSTGDANLPGNYGLWDQRMAIQWVHDNIAAFGGDPDQITLSGGSAGGASVIFQALFPANQGLFKRIIPQSGSVTCPWAFQPDPLKNAKRLASTVGCPTDVDTALLASCLREVSDEKYMEALNHPANKFRKFPLEFVVSVDREFVPLTPWEMLHSDADVAKASRKFFGTIDILTGLTEDEGFMMITPFVGVDDTLTFKTSRQNFEQDIVPEVIRVMYGEHIPDSVKRVVAFEYTDWTDPDNDDRTYDSFMRLSSDYVFNSQTIDIAKIHAVEKGDISNSYLYLLSALPSQHILWVPPTWNRGPVHGDEWPFILGYDSEFGYITYTHPNGQKPEDWELEMSQIVMKMWTNFVKTGDPNKPETIPLVWPKYTLETQLYLNISRDMNVGKKLFERGYNFWVNVMPDLVETVKTRMKIEEKSFCDKDASCPP